MDAPQELNQAAVDGWKQEIPVDLLPCLHCGYDLRGSAPSGSCPECGAAYRRETQYVDVVRQKLKEIIDDVYFIQLAGIFVASCAVGLALFFRLVRVDMIETPALFAMMFQVGLLTGAFYVLLIFLYAACWSRILFRIFAKKTVLWGQVQAVGLLRSLVLAGLGLTSPLVLIVLLV